MSGVEVLFATFVFHCTQLREPFGVCIFCLLLDCSPCPSRIICDWCISNKITSIISDVCVYGSSVLLNEPATAGWQPTDSIYASSYWSS